MIDLIVTSDGQLAFLFEDNGIIPIVGVADFFGLPTFVTVSDEIIYPIV